MKKDKKKCYRCGLGGHFACAQNCLAVEFKKSGSGNGSETIDLQVGGVVIKIVLIDSGSSCNIVDQKTWEELKSKGIKCKSEKSIQKIYPYG